MSSSDMLTVDERFEQEQHRLDAEDRNRFRSDRPDGIGERWASLSYAAAKQERARAEERGKLTWAHLVSEEWIHAMAAETQEELRSRLITAAARLMQWAHAVEAREWTP